MSQRWVTDFLGLVSQVQTTTTSVPARGERTDDVTLADVVEFLAEHFVALVTWVAVLAASVFAYLQWREARSLRAAANALAASGAAPTTNGPPLIPDADAFDRVMKAKILTVGTIVATPWFIWPSPGVGAPTGIYPAIFGEIGERKGIAIRYVPIRNDEIFSLLNSGEIDVAVQLLQTIERAQKALFAALIHHVRLVAVVRRGQTKIKSRTDLRKPSVRCAVVRGEIGHQIAPIEFAMTEANHRLVVLNTSDVPSVFYLVHGGREADVAITTGARWIELQTRDPRVAEGLEAIIDPLQLVPAGCLLKLGETRLAEWLEEQTTIARATPSVRVLENRLVKQFSAAVEKI